MNLFGKKQAAPTTSLADAIKKLKDAAEASQKREVYLQREKETARVEGGKRMKAKDKNGAMFYLKRMKAYDKEIAALYGKRNNLDTLVLSLEAASFDKGLVAAMTTAHHATKTMVTDADVERVQDLVGDLQESRRMAEEIGNALAEPIDNEEVDEAELLAAFEEQNVTEVDQQQDVLDFPTVPTHNIRTNTTTTTTNAGAAAARPAPAIPAGASSSSSSASRGNVQEEDEFKKLESMMAI